MANKDIKQKTKTSLMDELKSIKGVLNSDDDNVPLLLDDAVTADDNIPVLAGDDDIPVLTSPEETANKASLDDAIRQLESMELSPRSNKSRSDKPASLEEKIRSNAAPPLFEDKKFDDKATTVRENPFLAKKPTDRFAESRKEAEQALMSVIAHSKAVAQATRSASAGIQEKPAPASPKEEPKKPIEFTTAETTGNKTAKPALPSGETETDEDGSANILRLLDESPEVKLDLGDDFGELLDIDVDALINEKPPATKPAAAAKPVTKTTTPASASPNKLNDMQVDAIIDEVIEEYMIILEAALRKKLKEKLPDLLKK